MERNKYLHKGNITGWRRKTSNTTRNILTEVVATHSNIFLVISGNRAGRNISIYRMLDFVFDALNQFWDPLQE